MNTAQRLLHVAVALVTTGVLAPAPHAHGGAFKGPGDSVAPGAPGATPPGTPPAGGTGNVPTGPTAPGVPGATGLPSGPSGPVTGAAIVPALSSAAAVPAQPLSSWSDWWEVNKTPILALKGHVFAIPMLTGTDDFFLGHGERESTETSRPTPAHIERIAVPALRDALLGAASVDVASGSLMALAKIGRNGSANDSGELTRLFIDRLSDSSQEIRETAAMGLGILGDAAAREVLEALLNDESFAHALVGKQSVNDRTRAFAAFGLGLYGADSEDPARRARAVHELTAVLAAGSRATPDLEVACVTALGLVPLAPRGTGTPVAGPALAADPAPESPTVRDLEDQVQLLGELLDDPRRDRHVRAHAPAALARLVGGEDPAVAAARQLVRARLLATLRPESRQEREVVQGAILSLGELAAADDKEVHGALAAVLESSAGDIERGFALIALGRSGGRIVGPASVAGAEQVTETLLEHLARDKHMRRAWAALALGIQAYGLRITGGEPSTRATRALHLLLEQSSSPEIVGATAVALGLMNDRDAGELLRKKLAQVSDDRARGYLCVGLGLIGDPGAARVLQKVASQSQYRPVLLAEAAVGLGLLGDAQAVPLLIEMLDSAPSLAGQASIATALGRIGDSRSFLPLTAFLGDETKTTTARAFAAVALGIAADRSLLPWNETLRTGVQYRAATVTMRSGTGTGVLEIL